MNKKGIIFICIGIIIGISWFAPVIRITEYYCTYPLPIDSPFSTYNYPWRCTPEQALVKNPIFGLVPNMTIKHSWVTLPQKIKGYSPLDSIRY